MAQRVDDSHRQVVPRWWPFATAAQLGELEPSRTIRDAANPAPEPGEIETLVREFENNRTGLYAAAVLDAAVAFGIDNLAAETAQWILTNGGVSAVSVSMAEGVLRPKALDPPPLVSEIGLEPRWNRVALLRRRLRVYPRDAVLWVDIAREYASLGQDEQAARALRTAVALAPENRFVLRAATRFYLHAHDPEQAHRLLARAGTLVRDPWLLAAEIVAAQAGGLVSRHTKTGVKMIGSASYSRRSLSELAGAIGTLELEAGNRKQVRRLFGVALDEPTENAVAQASWVSRHMPAFDVPESSLAVPRAYEAAAWEAVRHGRHQDSVDFAAKWLKDEPFATRPVLLGSWVAAIAQGDFSLALGFVEAGRIANPADVRLDVQRFYCLASLNRVEEAASILPTLEAAAASGNPLRSTRDWEVLLEADKGLLAFRSQLPEQGRAHYARAIQIATENGLAESAATAYINLLREEARVGGEVVLEAREEQQLVEAFPEVSRDAIASFIGRAVRGIDESHVTPQRRELP